jgi:hypothetical protein
MYGEWLYAKHTVFYDALPHYFCEFDVLDRQEEVFLSTARRREPLAGSPVVSVPVLHTGPIGELETLTSLVGPSTCRTQGWRDTLVEVAGDGGADPARVLAETDLWEEMEGLYIKVEEDGETVGRICGDAGEVLENIALFREYCADQECVDRPRRFPSDHARFWYFRTPGRDPGYPAYDDTRMTVTVLSGLPGVGKDHWIATG